jgi:hypothetical protein
MSAKAIILRFALKPESTRTSHTSNIARHWAHVQGID